MNTILGLSAGLFGLILVIVGILGLSKKDVFGIKGLLGIIPIGNPKLWAILLIVSGFVFFGAWGYIASLGSSVTSSATALGADTAPAVGALALQNCRFNGAPMATTSATNNALNTTFRADPNDVTHYYVDVVNGTNSGAASINGTVSCSRPASAAGSYRDGQATTCIFTGGSFRSQTSTSDANTYYIVATSTTKSLVPGYTWQQTAYLNDNAVATTASNQELTLYTFPQDIATRNLGYLFTLPGATTMSYLNNQNGADAQIVCGGQTVARFTITKLAN